MFRQRVQEIPKKHFEHIFDGVKHKQKVKFDHEISAEGLKEIIVEYKKPGEERDRQGLSRRSRSIS